MTKKSAIRLNYKEILKAAIDKELDTDSKIAAAIGVSVTQLWRAKLPIDDPRYNSPGSNFIAGVLKTFDGPFERFFFLEVDIRGRIETNEKGGDQDAQEII